MLLSIVSGTYQRLPYLARMIASVRSQIPRHIGYEFVLVDGGSTDGTIEWCKTQADINLIQHGDLRGAIRAFTDGGKVAQGTYSIIANDDVEFHPHSILKAIVHLEENRTCGMVAFADNRLQQLGKASKHQTDGMPAIGTDGKPAWVTYGQIAMVRTWLANRIGWWGADDPLMGQGRTYAADNWLSAHIWQLGYSIDPVMGCTVDDLIPRDGLRARNNDSGANDSRLYYQAFPRGPQLKASPEVPNPQHDSLRVIVMDIHDPHLPARTAKEKHLAEAFSEVAYTWHIDQANEPFDLPQMMEDWQPHLVFIQLHDTSKVDAALLSRARAVKPECVFVTWCGDAHPHCYLSPDIIDTLRFVDLQLVVNAKVLPDYKRLGINAKYWQIGYTKPAATYDGEVPAYDVLIQWNCYDQRRHDLVAAIRKLAYDEGMTVGVYGNCHESDGNTHYQFDKQAALYASAKIVVSDTFPNTEGFVSNRLFQALGAGGFVLQEHSPRLDQLTGLEAGRHYIEWQDTDDLLRLIREWAAPECEAMRRAIAKQGMEFVRKEFSYPAQVKKLWKLLP